MPHLCTYQPLKRRSLRIAEKGSTTTDGSHGNYQVESLDELPNELDVRYLANLSFPCSKSRLLLLRMRNPGQSFNNYKRSRTYTLYS